MGDDEAAFWIAKGNERDGLAAWTDDKECWISHRLATICRSTGGTEQDRRISTKRHTSLTAHFVRTVQPRSGGDGNGNDCGDGRFDQSYPAPHWPGPNLKAAGTHSVVPSTPAPDDIEKDRVWTVDPGIHPSSAGYPLRRPPLLLRGGTCEPLRRERGRSTRGRRRRRMTKHLAPLTIYLVEDGRACRIGSTCENSWSS